MTSIPTTPKTGPITSTSLSTNSTATTPITPLSTEGTYKKGCPDINNSDYISPAGNGTNRFQRLCNVDLKLLTPQGTVNDIQNPSTATHELCIDQCVAYNQDGIEPACLGITWSSNHTFVSLVKGRQNCWLKKDVSNLLPADPSELEVSARWVR